MAGWKPVGCLVLLYEPSPPAIGKQPLKDLVGAEELYAVVLTSAWIPLRKIEPIGVTPTVGCINTENIDVGGGRDVEVRSEFVGRVSVRGALSDRYQDGSSEVLAKRDRLLALIAAIRTDAIRRAGGGL